MLSIFQFLLHHLKAVSQGIRVIQIMQVLKIIKVMLIYNYCIEANHSSQAGVADMGCNTFLFNLC